MQGLSRRAWSAIGLGVTLGGFFDGIVLHQVLQWHHLLSAVQADGWVDLRAQVLADGLFHMAMYLLAVVCGIALLVPDRVDRPAEVPRVVAARVLIGFATWHLLDAVLAHGLLGLHRIRMETGHPLAWDLGWLALFGGLPAGLGIHLLRRHRSDGQDGPGGLGGRRRSGAAATSLVVVVAMAGLVAGAPAISAGADPSSRLVLRAPGTDARVWLQSLARADARWIWMDARASVAVVHVDPGRPLPGWREGVWSPSGRLAAIACGGPIASRP